MRHILLCFGILALSGCGSSTDTIKVDDGKGGANTISSDGNKATITDQDGKTTTLNSGAETAKFADFAPQYPGSKIKDASYISADGTVSRTILLSTADTPEKVRAYYKASLVKAGMSPSEMGTDGAVILMAGQEAPSALISIAREEEGDVVLGTGISMMISTKE